MTTGGRAADDFEAIKARLKELQEGEKLPEKVETKWYNCPYEKSWAVRRNGM